MSGSGRWLGRGGVLLVVAGLAMGSAGCAATSRGGPGSTAEARASVNDAALAAARESARRGDHAQAVETLVGSLGDPSSPWTAAAEYQARQSLGTAYLWLGQQQRALGEFQRGLELALQLLKVVTQARLIGVSAQHVQARPGAHRVAVLDQVLEIGEG